MHALRLWITHHRTGSTSRDAEREKVLLFSQPYLENRLVLVGRKGADVSATGMSALKGRRIAIVEGYAYGDIDNAGPTFVRLRNDEASLTEQYEQALVDNNIVVFVRDNEARKLLSYSIDPDAE